MNHMHIDACIMYMSYYFLLFLSYLSMETLDSDTLDELSEGERDMIGSSRFARHIYNRKFRDEAAMMAGHMAEVRIAHPVLTERTMPTWYQRVTGRNNNNEQQDQANVRYIIIR